jgi:hypothetical protein
VELKKRSTNGKPEERRHCLFMLCKHFVFQLKPLFNEADYEKIRSGNMANYKWITVPTDCYANLSFPLPLEDKDRVLDIAREDFIGPDRMCHHFIESEQWR